MNIQLSPEEVLQAKFSKTIQTISGYLQEARGDMENGTSYSARAVHRRLEKITEAFSGDINSLAKAMSPQKMEVPDSVLEAPESPQANNQRTKIEHGISSM